MESLSGDKIKSPGREMPSQSMRGTLNPEDKNKFNKRQNQGQDVNIDHTPDGPHKPDPETFHGQFDQRMNVRKELKRNGYKSKQAETNETTLDMQIAAQNSQQGRACQHAPGPMTSTTDTKGYVQNNRDVHVLKVNLPCSN